MDYYFEPDAKSGALEAFKLVDDNLNFDARCPICGARAEDGLYNVQYEISQSEFVNFGNFCKEHRDMIFRFQ